MKSKSLLFYFGELLIVIIGVSIAFWLNQIGETRKEKKIMITYLQDLKSDVQYDIQLLDFAIENNEVKMEKFTNALQFFSNPDENKDSIMNYAFNVGSYNFFKPRDFTYTSIITSGDFKIIEDQGIKRELIRLYSQYELINEAQENFLDALDNNYFPYLAENVDYLTGIPNDPQFHNSLLIKNNFLYTLNDLDQHVKMYKFAKERALILDSLLTSEINPN